MITKKEILTLIPLAIFIAIAIHLGIALYGTQNAYSETPFMNRPVPDFSLFEFKEGYTPLKSADITNGVHILNFFASWCAPCKAEHKYLFELKQEGVKLHGIYFMDNSKDIEKYLTKYKNPYDTVSEENRELATVLGVMGLPETYVIDGKTKKIIYHQRGPIMADDVEETLLPLIAQTLAGQKK